MQGPQSSLTNAFKTFYPMSVSVPLPVPQTSPRSIPFSNSLTFHLCASSQLSLPPSVSSPRPGEEGPGSVLCPQGPLQDLVLELHVCPRPHHEDLDRLSLRKRVLPRSPLTIWYPPNPACVQGVPAHWGASLPTPSPQAIVFGTLEQPADLSLYESAAPTSPTRNQQGLENPPLCPAFSSLA